MSATTDESNFATRAMGGEPSSRPRLSTPPPGGALGKALAKLFQREPAIQARRDLRRFKQLMETGETWHGKHHVRVETVSDPQIVNPRDAIIRVTSTAICGSDLHLYDHHYIPTLKSGDILGHEFMGEVVEVGSGNDKLKVGQRVVVPFVLACGKCFFYEKQRFSACDNFNPAETADMSEKLYGYPMTGGIGPDAYIDAVGMESHGFTIDNISDHLKAAVGLATDRPHALRQVIVACRKGGRVSIPGVYGGMADKFPLGALMEKGLSVKSGQTHVQNYMPELLKLILDGKLDTTFLISHRLPLEEAADGYKIFKEQQNDVTKVVLKPGLVTRHQAIYERRPTWYLWRQMRSFCDGKCVKGSLWRRQSNKA